MKTITGWDVERLLPPLGTLAFFDKWQQEEIRALLADRVRVGIRSHPMGDFLIHEQDLGTALFLLLAGRASVVKNGSSIPLAHLEPGQFFGEVAFFTNRPRSSNVIAHGGPDHSPLRSLLGLDGEPINQHAVLVLRMDRELLDHLDPVIGVVMLNHIIGALGQRLAAMAHRILEQTGELPLLSIDDRQLAEVLQETACRGAAPHPSPDQPGNASQQRRMIDRLIQLQDEMTVCLLDGGG
ncbi:MAG: cyclic nucleotide-binding domain-containing protein [Magnetococcales bacterium]|nr:cyclic nucleotide-binding domain-containing protein [Magnetococcales bacterium]